MLGLKFKFRLGFRDSVIICYAQRLGLGLGLELRLGLRFRDSVMFSYG